MKDLNGIDATRQIKAQNPRARVVALSTYSDESYVLSMLQAGASGYVLKDAAVEEMRRAIRAVADGPPLPESADRGIRGGFPSSRALPGGCFRAPALAPRERQILQLLAEGHTSSEIARRLHIATTTVESHRRNIMKKLDLHSVAELTKYAIREGLTSLDR